MKNTDNHTHQFVFQETTSHGRFVGTHHRRIAQSLLSGHLLHNVQVYRPPKHPPEEVNDTVCTIEQRQDVQPGDDSQEDRQPLPHDGVLAGNLGRTPRRPAVVLVVPPPAVIGDSLHKALLTRHTLARTFVLFNNESLLVLFERNTGTNDHGRLSVREV